jgi:hypothetical protein
MAAAIEKREIVATGCSISAASGGLALAAVKSGCAGLRQPGGGR